MDCPEAFPGTALRGAQQVAVQSPGFARPRDFAGPDIQPAGLLAVQAQLQNASAPTAIPPGSPVSPVRQFADVLAHSAGRRRGSPGRPFRDVVHQGFGVVDDELVRLDALTQPGHEMLAGRLRPILGWRGLTCGSTVGAGGEAGSGSATGRLGVSGATGGAVSLSRSSSAATPLSAGTGAVGAVLGGTVSALSSPALRLPVPVASAPLVPRRPARDPRTAPAGLPHPRPWPETASER